MCDGNCKCRVKDTQPKWASAWDFEVVPIGTLARLRELEAKVGHPTVGEQSGNASPPRTLPPSKPTWPSETIIEAVRAAEAAKDYLR